MLVISRHLLKSHVCRFLFFFYFVRLDLHLSFKKLKTAEAALIVRFIENEVHTRRNIYGREGDYIKGLGLYLTVVISILKLKFCIIILDFGDFNCLLIDAYLLPRQGDPTQVRRLVITYDIQRRCSLYTNSIDLFRNLQHAILLKMVLEL
jgi:hypothetical protein